MECVIRTGTLEDAARVSLLITRLAEEFIVTEFSEEGCAHFLNELTPDKVGERLAGDYRFFLAEVGTELAGVAALRGNAHLYYLFVAKSYQRRGLARQLWLRARQSVLASGHQGVITVNSSTYAAPVYERFGFARKGPPEEKHGVLHHPMELLH